MADQWVAAPTARASGRLSAMMGVGLLFRLPRDKASVLVSGPMTRSAPRPKALR